MPVHNEDIAAGFDEMADLLALSGENPFRIRAYRRAAQVIRTLPRELHEQMAEGLDPDSLPGIGADLAQKIREFNASGECHALEQLRKSVPKGLRTLLALPEIGPQRARALFSTLGVHDLATLRAALEKGRVREVPHFGAKLEQRLLKTLAVRELHGKRMLRSVAGQYAAALKDYLAGLSGVSRVELAGSFRRGRETVGDLDVLVCAGDQFDLSSALRQYDETASVLASGSTRGSITLRNGLQVDVRVVPPESVGAALYYFTGSKEHNIHVRRLAMARGLKLNEYGVFRGTARIAGETEESVLATLGLPMIPPELREDHGEIEAASSGHLPHLIERSQLRGDLHVHTKQTDGSASLQQMAQAAQRAGLAYIAITDHSKYLGAVHGLDAKELAQQMEAIDAFNAKQKHIAVLKGIEVDILKDGALALPDTILKQLDVVVVAVHGHFGLTKRQQTNRLLRALDHRYVSILAHPTTRLLVQRPAIDCDWSKVFKRAAERPCYLELNSQPARLDLDDAMLREAGANGVAISIATDAHGIGDFANLEAGILQARRGWLEPEKVINTKPIAELRKLLRQTFA